MNSLLKKSFRILLGRGVVSIFTLLFTVYFAYELPKTIFALIALYDLAVSLSKVFTDLGLHYYVLREAPSKYYSDEQDATARTILFPSIIIRFSASLIVCLVYAFVLLINYERLQESFPELNILYITIITTFHLLIENAQNILIPVFAVKQKFGTNSVLESSTTLAEGVLALGLFIIAGINYYFLGLLAGQLIILLIRWFYIRDVIKWRYFRSLSIKSTIFLLKDNFPFYLRKFFRIGFVQGEQLVIAALLPLTQIANYKVAKKCSNFLKQYILAFIDPLTIKLSRTRDLEIRRKYVKTYLWFTLPVPILLACASPWIMSAAGGSKYENSWFMLCILYLSYCFASLSALQLNILTIFGKKTEALFRDAVGGTTGLTATIVLVLLFDEYGIAWGQLISYIVLALLGYQLARKYINLEAPVGTQNREENTDE